MHRDWSNQLKYGRIDWLITHKDKYNCWWLSNFEDGNRQQTWLCRVHKHRTRSAQQITIITRTLVHRRQNLFDRYYSNMTLFYTSVEDCTIICQDIWLSRARLANQCRFIGEQCDYHFIFSSDQSMFIMNYSISNLIGRKFWLSLSTLSLFSFRHCIDSIRT